MKGRGTAYANERPIPVRKGDLIYYDDRERHYLRSEGDEDMVFVEFFVPGEYKTVWVEGAPVCTWLADGAQHARRKAGARDRRPQLRDSDTAGRLTRKERP